MFEGCCSRPGLWQFVFFNLRVTLLCAACISDLWAEPLVVDKIYQSGALVESAELGVALTIPGRYQAVLPSGSTFLVIEHTSYPASIYLYAENLTAEDMKALMSDTIPLAPGLVLRPSSELRQEGDQLVADFTLVGNTDLVSRISSTTGTTGLSVALIAVTLPNTLDQVWEATQSLAKSLSFTTPASTEL